MTAGSIVRLKLEHFMTYDSLEVTPCPGLNLITGPNGTGKSTLLCAMCLGLAGKPSSIGRSERISDFIKNGFDQACIEVELLNPDGANIVIGRSINLTNTSQWTLNGKQSSLKMIEKEISKFNIQTNNLCQFLPQEKVADFTKMNQKELLENTEQAVGDQSMFDNHVKLKQLGTNFLDSENSLNGIKAQLEREVEKNKRLEGEVQQHQEREKQVKRVKLLERKIPWMKYEKIRGDYTAMVQEKKKLNAEFNKCSALLEPKKKEIADLNKELTQLSKNTESLDKEIQKKKQECYISSQKLEVLDSKVSDMKFEVTENIKSETTRVEKLRSLVTVLKNLVEELREAEADDVGTQKEYDVIQQKAMEIRIGLLDAQTGMGNSMKKQEALKQNLQEILNSLNKHRCQQQQRYNSLRDKEPDAYKAMIWLRENEHLFKKKIYEPILTLINVPDPSSVKYIEDHLAYRDLTAFFAEDSDDMNKFLKIVSDQQGLDISGIHAPPVPESRLQPRMSKEGLRCFGLTTYLKELFTAPYPVMNYLCHSYRLHDIPVVYQRTERDIANHPQFPFLKFYAGDFKYRIKTSRYGNHSRSSTSQKIIDSGLLRGHVDAAEVTLLEDKRKELECNIRDEDAVYLSYCENEKNFNAQLEQLRVQQKDLAEKRNLVKDLTAKINSIKEKVKVAQNPECDIEEEKRRLSCFLTHSVQEKGKILGELSKMFENVFALEREKLLKCFSLYFLLTKKDKAERAYRDASGKLCTLEVSLNQVKTESLRLKSEVQVALGNAKKALGLKISDAIPQDLKSKIDEEFSGLPTGVSELENELAREQSKLNCTNLINPGVINEYMRRENAIKELRSTIATKEEELKELETNIQNIRDQWLPAIETLIEKISVNFSRYFQSLGCAGEVTLDKTDNPNDFHKYGISIKVKFRDDEPLNQLSHAHHSGGECSVSTILFMLSLQELTEVPFRCVDEINQGMDSINERSIFDLIVKSSCSKKKSQYFLITPKLLHGLEYPPEMEIAIIHNGSSKKCNWDIENFLRIKSSLNS